MFCSDCGTQIDEGSKFCKNCGVRVAKADVSPSTMVSPKLQPTSSTGEVTRSVASTPEAISESKPATVSPKGRSDRSASRVIVAIVFVLVIGAGAAVYFGSDLFRNSALTDDAPAPGPQPSVSNSEPPPIAPIEGHKGAESLNGRDLNAASPLAPSEPLSMRPAETPNGDERNFKARAKSDGATQSRQSSNPLATSKLPAQVAKSTPAPNSHRPAFNPGTYETLRSTNVFDGPAPSARIVADIEEGVRINVVASNGDWLEVHSRRGNAAGFIRKDDARLVNTDQ